MKIISPTGLGIREWDKWGSGRFRAPRKKLIDEAWVSYDHKGADFRIIKQGEIFKPGKIIVSPCDGKVIREVFPYQGTHYRGILIANEFGDFKLFYVSPFPRILRVGKKIKVGEEIGLAQDISKKYPGMTPHIHLQIEVHGNNLWSGKQDFINPEMLM